MFVASGNIKRNILDYISLADGIVMGMFQRRKFGCFGYVTNKSGFGGVLINLNNPKIIEMSTMAKSGRSPSICLQKLECFIL